MTNFEHLKGLVLTSITINDAEDEILIKSSCGREFKMLHYQDCCESVYVESLVGCISSVLGHEILIADESSEDANDHDAVDDSGTWTFYKLDTAKGGITIRWLGESNGFYSESVDFEEILH